MQPDNAKLLHQKGLAYQRQSEFIQAKEGGLDPFLDNLAIDLFKKAIKANANFISSQHHLGIMYHRTLQYQNALQCFSLVLERVSNDKTVYLARGLVYQDMENHQLAINDFNNVIKYDSALSEGYLKRGWSKFYLKRF
jgi:tetratricopeptide (TPR) repeat protein